MSETPGSPPRIDFPCDHYPIKVVARAAPDLRARLDVVFERHFGAFPESAVAERLSAQGNFAGYTYHLRVETVEQLGAVHAELRTLSEVVMVL